MDNLMENIRSFFMEQYKGMNRDRSFISFEPLGTIIDPSDFAGDNAEIVQIKATEQLSILGDRLPQIDEVYLPNSNRLSSVYETLIASASFTNEKITTSDIGPYLARFSEKQSDALQKLEEGKKSSIRMPEGEYLPVYASPINWFDPNGSFWIEKKFSEIENTPTPATPPTKKLPFLWRNKIIVDQNLLDKVETVSVNKRLNISPTLLTQLKTVNNPVFSNQIKLQNISNNAIKLDRATIKPFNRIGTNINLDTQAQPIANPAINEPIKIDTIKLFRNKDFLNTVKLADRIKLTGVLADDANTKPVNSNGFSMSFKYSLVYFNRPWFDTSLFALSRTWFCLSLKEDFFSNGENNETNQGLMKCLPTAMILIKDLKIKAAWSDDDKKNAEDSVALGIFNIEDNQIVQNELSSPGIQVIGWICDVMPKLPEISDPNFS